MYAMFFGCASVTLAAGTDLVIAIATVLYRVAARGVYIVFFVIIIILPVAIISSPQIAVCIQLPNLPVTAVTALAPSPFRVFIPSLQFDDLLHIGNNSKNPYMPLFSREDLPLTPPGLLKLRDTRWDTVKYRSLLHK